MIQHLADNAHETYCIIKKPFHKKKNIKQNKSVIKERVK